MASKLFTAVLLTFLFCNVNAQSSYKWSAGNLTLQSQHDLSSEPGESEWYLENNSSDGNLSVSIIYFSYEEMGLESPNESDLDDVVSMYLDELPYDVNNPDSKSYTQGGKILSLVNFTTDGDPTYAGTNKYRDVYHTCAAIYFQGSEFIYIANLETDKIGLGYDYLKVIIESIKTIR
ncbi:hypothetical protein [Ekhidna sp.]|uniref:hypothetical protein n=1 Tax=Ekhidna sp. TaxID=2608089 RepID=UPI003B5C6395